MQSGVVLGYIGLVSGLLTALRGELVERSPAGCRVTVVATGGHIHQPWIHEVPGIDAFEADLTLRGIRYAWEALRERDRPAQAAQCSDRDGRGAPARSPGVASWSEVSGSIADPQGGHARPDARRARRRRRRGDDPAAAGRLRPVP